MRNTRSSQWSGVGAVVAMSTSVCADTLNVPADYATIQAAIDASVDGDVVLVADGEFTGPGNRDLDLLGKAIIVRSVSGAESCIINVMADKNDPHRAFHFHTGEGADSIVQGFTITNGFMDRGGAILCEGGGLTAHRRLCLREQHRHVRTRPRTAAARSASPPWPA